MSFGRKKIKDYVYEKNSQIHPSFCVGRENEPLTVEDRFAMKFFDNCSDSMLYHLEDIANELKVDEILVSFFKKRKNEVTSLTSDEMQNFDFNTLFSCEMLTPSWDEFRDIPQHIMAIIFV